MSPNSLVTGRGKLYGSRSCSSCASVNPISGSQSIARLLIKFSNSASTAMTCTLKHKMKSQIRPFLELFLFGLWCTYAFLYKNFCEIILNEQQSPESVNVGKNIMEQLYCTPPYQQSMMMSSHRCDAYFVAEMETKLFDFHLIFLFFFSALRSLSYIFENINECSPFYASILLEWVW